jgi:hypothetical protein
MNGNCNPGGNDGFPGNNIGFIEYGIPDDVDEYG